MLILWIGLFCAACGGGSGNGENGAPASGTGATDSAPVVELLPAAEQQGGSLAVRVRDGAGQPITDGTVRLEGDMNHAGMIPVISEPVTHEADGIYRVPFEFTMLGDWIISVYVTTADGAQFDTRLEMSVREGEMVIP